MPERLKKDIQDNGHQHTDEHTHDHGDGHDHHHHGKYTEVIFSLSCGLLLAVGFALSGHLHLASLVLYIGAYFFGGFFTLTEAIENIRAKRFDIDSLMLIAAIGAAILGDWAEGALLLFLFSLGHSLEHYAMNKARRSIAALAGLAPKTALLKQDGALTEVPIAQLQPGSIIVIKPNSKIPADGLIIAGSSSVDQSPITGESLPVDKTASTGQAANNENRIFAGTINGNGSLEVKVEKQAEDSTLSRLIKLVNEAQRQKAPVQHLTDRFQTYFVPFVVVLVTLLCFAYLVIDEPFSRSFYRAMSVLVAASPCALAIATPSAILSGIARAARAGVLVKGGRPLLDLGTIQAIAFDKTGTLTKGQPRLTSVLPAEGVTEDALLEAVIAVEQLSDHPLAKAIVKDASERLKKEVSPASNLEAIQGKGVKATWQHQTIQIGNAALFATGLSDDLQKQFNTAIQPQFAAAESKGQTVMAVQQDNRFLGLITVMDQSRPEAAATLQELKQAGISRIIMLSGDSQKVADAIATNIGVTEARGQLLPEEKVSFINQLKSSGNKVAMVGDGVNDAPAMASSTVGIAMGAAGSDVALETADLALMGDQLDKLPFAIALSRQARRIVRQNLVISLGMVAILIPLTMLGLTRIGPAVMGHEGSTILVAMNALRLLAFKHKVH
jgi:Zn2+/Cd2+-exporting ATPase